MGLWLHPGGEIVWRKAGQTKQAQERVRRAELDELNAQLVDHMQIETAQDLTIRVPVLTPALKKISESGGQSNLPDCAIPSRDGSTSSLSLGFVCLAQQRREEENRDRSWILLKDPSSFLLL